MGNSLRTTEPASGSLLEMRREGARKAAERLLSHVSGLNGEHPDRQKANLRIVCKMLDKYAKGGNLEGISDPLPHTDAPMRIKGYLGRGERLAVVTEPLDESELPRDYPFGHGLMAVLDSLAYYIRPRNDGKEHIKVSYCHSTDGNYAELWLHGEKLLTIPEEVRSAIGTLLSLAGGEMKPGDAYIFVRVPNAG